MTSIQTTSKNSKKRSRSAEPSSDDASGTGSGQSTPEHALHASERFEIVEIHRSEIKEADYNPRFITEDARRRLKKAIEKVGLLAPITWNRRTGRVVGGHQRLRALDTINGNRDYYLRVAAVDMDETEEKAANLLLNNTEAQGEWELEKLGEILKAPDLDLVIAGFDASDVFKIVGDTATDTVLTEIADRVEQVKQARENTTKHNDTTHSSHWFLVVVFRDDEERLAFTERLGLQNNRYVDGRQLAGLLASPPPPPAEEDDDEELGVEDLSTSDLREVLNDPELEDDLREDILAELAKRGE